MLAHGFMLASELGLSEVEHRALMDVLWGLESGEFVHCQPHEVGLMPGHAFNMSEWCGTVGCIAGWADTLHGTRMRHEHEGRKGLEELFLVRTSSATDRVRFDEITVSQAAAALRNYLTTGRARWGEVLPRRDERASVRKGLWGE